MIVLKEVGVDVPQTPETKISISLRQTAAVFLPFNYGRKPKKMNCSAVSYCFGKHLQMEFFTTWVQGITFKLDKFASHNLRNLTTFSASAEEGFACCISIICVSSSVL